MNNFPKVKSFECQLNGEATFVDVTLFHDCIWIALKQINKVGTVIKGFNDKKDHKTAVFGGRPTFTIEVLLGNRQNELLPVAVRQLLAQIDKISYRLTQEKLEALKNRDSNPENLIKTKYFGLNLSKLSVVVSFCLKHQNNEEYLSTNLSDIVSILTQAVLAFETTSSSS